MICMNVLSWDSCPCYDSCTCISFCVQVGEGYLENNPIFSKKCPLDFLFNLSKMLSFQIKKPSIFTVSKVITRSLVILPFLTNFWIDISEHWSFFYCRISTPLIPIWQVRHWSLWSRHFYPLHLSHQTAQTNNGGGWHHGVILCQWMGVVHWWVVGVVCFMMVSLF